MEGFQFLSMYNRTAFPEMLGFPHSVVAGSKSNYIKRQEVEAASRLRAWGYKPGTESHPLNYIDQADTEST